MRKSIITVSIALTAILYGCALQGSEKVNFIPGPGSANSSLLVGFSKLCQGSAERLLGGGRLLVSRREEIGLSLYLLDVSTKAGRLVAHSENEGGYSLQVSPTGESLLLDNLFVNIEDGKTSVIPYTPPQHGGPSAPGYSYTREGELLLSNPFYYRDKYMSGEKTGLSGGGTTESAGFIKLGDPGGQHLPESLRGLELPEPEYIKAPFFSLEGLLYSFIGVNSQTGTSLLYVFDLYTKEFRLIGDKVLSYELSPDLKKLLYISESPADKDVYSLWTANIDGTEKKELLRRTVINGAAWSPDAQWIAYSGSNSREADIGLIKTDGSRREQLTYGMDTRGSPVWWSDGSKLAFTSSPEGKPEVYLISLNLKTEAVGVQETTPDRTRLSKELLDFMRRETAEILKKNAD